MNKNTPSSPGPTQEHSVADRLDSWKEIAAYLKREPRTVQRWEKNEGLPVHRHLHDKQGTVYAYKPEIDAWWEQRRVLLESEPDLPELEEAAPSPSQAPPVPGPSRRDKAILFAILVAVVVIAGWFVRSRFGNKIVPSGKIMLAVLPFDNLSGDPEQKYISDGLTEEMITQLGRLHPERLGVIARTTVMDADLEKSDVTEVGRRLRVQYVLEGSFRRAGENIRITAQLIQVVDQTHLWAESYDVERPLSEMLEIQSEVAQKVANALAIELLPDQRARLQRPRHVDPRAYEAYLRGRAVWDRRLPEEGLQRSMRYFQQALQLDLKLAVTHAGLADQYITLGFYSVLPPHDAYSKAREAANKALAADPLMAEAHASLASVLSEYDWNWAEAEREFKRAIELNPSYPIARQWYAAHLAFMGRFDEGWRHIEVARQIDPVGLVINADVALHHYYRRQFDRVIAHCREIMQLDPDFRLAHIWMGSALAQQGQFEEAIREFERARGEEANLFPTALLGYAYGRAGRIADARRILREFEHLSRTRFVSAAYQTLVYIGLGDNDKALQWMEKAFEERSPLLVRLKVEPVLDPLRGDPRFQDLVRRVGLP